MALNSPKEQVSIAFQRTHFHVRLAFAMTISISQGQTSDFVGLYFPAPVFLYGQLYVALSRIRTPNSIKIMIDHKYKTHLENVARNVVHKEVL